MLLLFSCFYGKWVLEMSGFLQNYEPGFSVSYEKKPWVSSPNDGQIISHTLLISRNVICPFFGLNAQTKGNAASADTGTYDGLNKMLFFLLFQL